MPDLTTTQLEGIQRLITDPLREAVRAEMQAGHDRLAGAVEKVAEQLAAHRRDALEREAARDQRLDCLERRVTALERFRGRILVVYAALALILSFACSLARDWIRAALRRN